ncbi:hypothetical protein AB4Y87_00520 [Paenarthrobacter sp. RAF54_2]|uniref:hypothetical protein n=1 Tax=Paenarthrobacter sp. RAF54_2 TaxID=3233061 RepID=UPI003F99798E
MTINETGQSVPEMPAQPPKHEEEKVTPSPEPNESASDEMETASLSVKKLGWRRRQNRTTESMPSLEQSRNVMESDDVTPSTPRRNRRWIWVAALSAALLGAAVFLGSILPDPKSSGEYKSLQADNVRLTTELNKAKTEYKTLEDGMKAREVRVTASGQELTKREEAVKVAEAAVKKREEAVTAAEKQKAANTVREGTWTVGVDIEPGTYRTDTEVSSSCYWGIYRTGSNGSDIIDNDIVSGGRPTVTLVAGQDFKTTRCGAWTKQ